MVRINKRYVFFLCSFYKPLPENGKFWNVDIDQVFRLTILTALKIINSYCFCIVYDFCFLWNHRVPSGQGKPGKPGKRTFFEKSQGKPGKVRENFGFIYEVREKSGNFFIKQVNLCFSKSSCLSHH